MKYINAIASVSHQESFNNPGFSAHLTNAVNVDPIHPDYKEYIEGALIRRMTPILKMGVSCAEFCKRKINGEEFEAIIFGTGFGCLTDSEKFLDAYITIEGLLPPTSFIQSTHNTIAGQVSLLLKNRAYNTTYTQNSVSFEMALQDGLLCLNEGMNNVLIGAADERIPFLERVVKELGFHGVELSTGVTCMVLSNEKSEHSLAEIKASKVVYKPGNIEQEISGFLSENGLDLLSIDKLHYSAPPVPSVLDIAGVKLIHTNKIAGIYPTNSAFAVHVAVDEIAGGKVKNVLIINNLNPAHLGLTLVQQVQ